MVAGNQFEASASQAAGFDPNAMADYFKQAGWQGWNPMMMMGSAMNYGMQMPTQGYGNDNMGGQQGGSYRGGGRGRGGLNAFGQQRGGGGDGPGPVRNNNRRGYAPY